MIEEKDKKKSHKADYKGPVVDTSIMSIHDLQVIYIALKLLFDSNLDVFEDVSDMHNTSGKLAWDFYYTLEKIGKELKRNQEEIEKLR